MFNLRLNDSVLDAAKSLGQLTHPCFLKSWGTASSLPRSNKQFHSPTHKKVRNMIDDEALGVIANFLGIFIFGLVIAYHLVTADPKYEAS
ncbi:hypothetical protein VNO80_28484 [Phaseolus coccineus]|uniref:Dolichyl-diphosphooligosaccharide--protein glycosyltransferase subunit 4 n=1 Tax=Phaseolus coccineus TaxID=3886 RepID=A0AAN9QE23_PHACN